MKRGLLIGFCLSLCGIASAAKEEGGNARLDMVGLEFSDNGDEIRLLASAHKSDGSSAKLESPRLLFDGKESAPPITQNGLYEYAAENAKWVPPIAVGLVYQWSQGTPQGMIEGVEGLCRRLPGKIMIFPTPYGQGYRPVVTKVTAARAAGGDLADYPPIPGDRQKLVEAIRFNANKLIEDDAILKYLVVITDGRGYESAREKGPFAAIGEELKKRDIRVLVVSFPAPADGAESAANVREFAQAAQAQHVVVSKTPDLPALVESLAESITGWNRLRFPVPWSLLASKSTISLRAEIDGSPVTIEAGAFPLPGHGRWLLLAIAGVLLLGGGVAGFVFLRKGIGSPRGATFKEAPPGILRDADQLVRLGLSAERIVIELSQLRHDDIEELRKVEVLRISRKEYPHLASRPGQIRLREVQKLLARSGDRDIIDEATAQIIEGALKTGSGAGETARRIRARIPSETWSVLARAEEDELSDAMEGLRQQGTAFASSRGREFTRLVQEALRTREDGPVLSAWLVRATGPGKRGETLPVAGNPCVIGRRNANIEVPRAEDEHATIRVIGPDFVLEAVDGEVQVEGKTLSVPHTMTDGEVLQIAGNAFVFRSVRWAPPLSAGRARAPRRKSRPAPDDDE